MSKWFIIMNKLVLGSDFLMQNSLNKGFVCHLYTYNDAKYISSHENKKALRLFYHKNYFW